MISFDQSRPDFSPYGLTCVHWTPTPMPRPDHHSEIELNLLESGWLAYLLGGQKVRIEAGQLSAFWAAIPHQIIGFSPRMRYFVVTIPLANFLKWKMPESFVQAMLRGEILQESKPACDCSDQSLFSQWEEDLNDRSRKIREIVLIEIEARLQRMSTAFPEDQPGAADSKSRRRSLDEGPLNKVEQIACFIAQHYTEPLRVGDICASVGLDSDNAMTLSKKVFGMTLIKYLTHHRLAHAKRLLATTGEKIVDVAFESGFNSVSAFNEAFRRSSGCSPREYRSQIDRVDFANAIQSRRSLGRLEAWGC
jgi:AraC family transcriptional regulator, melibiose operon regulatory protein